MEKVQGNFNLEPLSPTQASGRHDELDSGVIFTLHLNNSIFEARDLPLQDFIPLGNIPSTRIQKVLHCPSATEMIEKTLPMDTEINMRKQIAQELKVVRDCVSRNILSFYGFSIQPDEIRVYEEYMDVGTLADISKNFGPLNLEMLGKVCEAVLGALSYLYLQHRIIHRDLRPCKIILNSRGEIKLRGFGTSKHLDSTFASTMVGSPIYMAPERIAAQQYNAKSDTWSFGMTLLELMVGRYPYDVPSDGPQGGHDRPGTIELLTKIVRGPPPQIPVSSVTPQSLYDLIENCLRKDPDERPYPYELMDSHPFLLASKATIFDVRQWATMVKQSLSGPFLDFTSKPQATLSTSTAETAQSDAESSSGGAYEEILKHLEMCALLSPTKSPIKENRADLCGKCHERVSEHLRIVDRATPRHLPEPEAEALSKCSLCLMIQDAARERSPSRLAVVDPADNQVTLSFGFLEDIADRALKAGVHLDDKDSGSPAAFQLVATWIYRCITKHKYCHVAMIPRLPTRVLDVGPADGSANPRLRDGASRRGIYIAFSYRWDLVAAKGFQTTEANLKAHEEEIKIDSLPKCMQDAIEVTRRLGVRYLWIDALCIVQDSESDWASESVKMAEVYKNCLLTIAAAVEAESDHCGLFQPRKRLQTRPIEIDGPYAGARSRYIFADRRLTGDGARPYCTLDTRAWVLQEQVLPKRILSYTAAGLYWDCVTHNASESFPDGIPEFYDPDTNRTSLRHFKQLIFHHPLAINPETAGYHLWRRIVVDYSARKMSKESDKLIAISGLAQQVASCFNDRLVAGLWERWLWRDLLWYVVDVQSAQRPVSFSAPSWSWASVNAQISYELRGTDAEHLLIRLIQIVDVNDHAADLNDIATSVHGSIAVRGTLVPLKAIYDNEWDASPPLRSTRQDPRSSPVWIFSARVWPDVLSSVDLASVQCLIIAASSNTVYALALQHSASPEHKPSLYRRIGLVTWKDTARRFQCDDWAQFLKTMEEAEDLEPICLE